MQTFLDQPKTDRRIAFEQTAARKGIVASSVEKDFWVCWALMELFGMPALRESLVFKGGTSLSKAWGLIDRFSEDIDLTIDRRSLGFVGDRSPETATKGQRAKLLKRLRGACRERVQREVLPYLEERIRFVLKGENAQIEIDEHDRDGQTLLLRYPALVGSQSPPYVTQAVKIEFGARSDPWPTERRKVCCFVNESFPEQFAKGGFEVVALLPSRTFLEKVMALHEEGCRPIAKGRALRMARHYYDIHRLFEQGVAEEALKTPHLLRQTAQHREVYFRQSWMDYDTLRPGRLRIVPGSEQEAAWKADYQAMGPEMFVSVPPSFEALMKSAREIERRVNEVDWLEDPPS